MELLALFDNARSKCCIRTSNLGVNNRNPSLVTVSWFRTPAEDEDVEDDEDEDEIDDEDNEESITGVYCLTAGSIPGVKLQMKLISSMNRGSAETCQDDALVREVGGVIVI
jgi:hypothetical protein